MNEAVTALGGLNTIGNQPPYPVAPTNDVVIQKVENGFIVRVGCKSFVAKELGEIFDGLSLYFTKPEEARLKYCSKS